MTVKFMSQCVSWQVVIVTTMLLKIAAIAEQGSSKVGSTSVIIKIRCLCVKGTSSTTMRRKRVRDTIIVSCDAE